MKKALLVAALAVFPLSASAQVKAPARAPAEVINFGEVPLDGHIARPTESYVVIKRATTFASMVRLRSNFAPELQRSVDAL